MTKKRKRTDRRDTRRFEGLVVPSKWNDDGAIVEYRLETEDEEYRLDDYGNGFDINSFLDSYVAIDGVLEVGQRQPTLKVISIWELPRQPEFEDDYDEDEASA